MATKKISELPAGVALTGPEVAPFVQSGATVGIDADAVKTYALGDFSAFGLTFGALSGAPAARTALAVYSSAQVDAGFQPLDADLTIYAGITPSANVQSLLGAASYAAMRTQLTLVIGTNVQAYSANLTTFAGITPSADVQTMLAAANNAAIRAAIGAGTGGGTVTASGSPSSGYLAKWTSATDLTKTDLSGDVTTSGGVATTIANSAVTLAKIANAAANSRWLGAGAAGSGGAYTENTFGNGLTVSGTALAVNYAAASDLNTGTDTVKAINSDVLAGSNHGIRYIAVALNGTTALTTSEKGYVRIPAALTGMNLVTVAASVGTGAAGSSSSGDPTFTVKNVTDGNQMLSTSLTVDANEYTSATAAIAAAINASFDDVVTDDLIEVACTTAGTGTTYATVTLGFQLP